METIQQARERFRSETETELQDILGFWMAHAVDDTWGGFFGQIDESNQVQPGADKGSVLNSRLLWTFSAAFERTGRKDYLAMAQRAFAYLTGHFVDREQGGLYWTIDYQGRPLDTKKQIYALAFGIYGLSMYYRCTRDETAKTLAIQLYHDIEKHSFDPLYTGYIDAFARDWAPMEDIRLSLKDRNEKKTMNTHLHVLEAYTGLYRIWPDPSLKEKILLLLGNFTEHIIDRDSGHLILFFDDRWNRRSGTISFGHDIEASWLIQEAAEAIGAEPLIRETKELGIRIADAAAEGLSEDGGLWYEQEGDSWIREKHWWPQAEAMVGFLNAYQHSGKDLHLLRALKSWDFIKAHLRSPTGEWWWGVGEDGSPMPRQDKAGLWKCPYHNSRACLEVSKRLALPGKA